MYKQEKKTLPDYKSKSLVSSFNRLKSFVNTLNKKRHNTLLKLTDKEKINVT
jgi:hypothetical protein